MVEVKHCLPSEVKHYLIPSGCAGTQNQLMLDAHELARRLREAMDTKQPRLSSAALAAACKVTDQAVNGWRKTGRLAKKHLPTIARETGRPLEYFLGQETRGITTNYDMTLTTAEGLAIKNLRDALPEWRRYVTSLAMTTSKERQQLFLDMLQQHVPDETVAKAFGPAPHVEEKK